MIDRDKIPFMLVLGLIWITTLGLALWSIDFGYHWDEHLLTDSVQERAGEGLYLPGWYNYPSLAYDLTLTAMAPELAASVVNHRQVRDHQGGMAGYWADHIPQNLILRSRCLSAVMTLLPILGVGLIAWLTTGNRWASILGALTLAGSFEYFYHARWLAPDGLMACLAFLTTVLVVLYWRERRWMLLLLAALTAGLTCGAKYPGGLFLIPVLLVPVLVEEPRRGWTLVGNWCQIGAVFLLGFVMSTPGSVLEPYKFLGDITRELSHYKNGHGAYTVDAPLEHAGRMAWYFLTVVPSRFPLLGVLLWIPALWGAVCLGRREWRLLLLILVAPTIYALYFSMQKAMLVRNYLVLVPFLGLLVAWGIHDLQQRLASIPARWGLRCAVLVIGLINLTVLAQTSWSVRQRSMADPRAEILSFLEEHSDHRFTASAQVQEVLGELPQNVVREPSALVRGHLVFLQEPMIKSMTNRSGYVIHATGPREVNLDYYSSWAGDQRIVVLDPSYSPKKFR